MILDRSYGVGFASAGKWLGNDQHGLATAILTKRNSVAISTAQKAEKSPAQTLIALRTAMAQSLVREIDGHVRADAGTREGFRSALIPAASAISSKERSLVAWS